MKKSDLKEKVKKISLGILSEVVDIVLWELVYLSEVGVSSNSRGAWEARFKADKFLEEVNFQAIKRAIERLKEKGFIEKTNYKKNVWPKITQEGKRRLEEILPSYQKTRTWDGKIYLLTYDIAERRRKDRDRLRLFIKRLGMGMLQESVWITPYNPQDVLEDFIKEKNLSGAIIISTIGKDGSIGTEDIKTLIAKVYHLKNLNKRYLEFINQVKLKKFINPVRLQFSYMSILKDDPQLPFVLLPSDWYGDESYKIYRHTSVYSKL